MTRQILHALQRNAGKDQSRDIGVPQDMRRDLEIHCHNDFMISDLVPKFIVIRDTAYIDGAPHGSEGRVGQRTSILIMVGTALDTLSQLESQLKMYDYEGIFK